MADQHGENATPSGGALGESPGIVSALLRDLTVMVYRFRNDKDWPLESAGEGCRALTGYHPPGGTDQSGVSRRSLIHAEDQQAVWNDTRAALSDKRPFELVYRIRTAMGDEKWVLDKGRGVFSSAGELVALEGFMTEAAALKRMEAAPGERTGRLRPTSDEQRLQRQKLEAMGTLAAGIAHDFNNVLTAISGHLDLAKEALGPEHPAMASLKMVEEATAQAAGVTQSLLTFCRGTAVEKSPLNLGRVVGDSTRLLHRVFPAAVEIVEDLPPKLDLWVNANATQLQQILMNIAINARNAMPDGGVLRVAVHSEQADPADTQRPLGNAVLTVEDTGVDMPEEVRARLVEPLFAVGHGVRETDSAASDIHGIISALQGTVNVDSAPGGGTRVRITLPCCWPADERAGVDARPETARGQGEGVIVVEDNDHVRWIMTSTLRAQGYDVVQVQDGVQAMRALFVQRRADGAVVLDLDLPKRDGLSCLEEIRRTRPDIAVVLVTGCVDFASDQPVEGVDRLLRKPFPMSELAAAVAEAMAKQRARKEVTM